MLELLDLVLVWLSKHNAGFAMTRWILLCLAFTFLGCGVHESAQNAEQVGNGQEQLEPAEREIVGQELERLQGRWKLTSGHRDGSASVDPNTQLVLTPDTITLIIGGKHYPSPYNINPTKSPKQIDIVKTTGPNKGKSGPGIYALEEDELKICIANYPGGTRPTTFAVKQGSGHTLFVFRRAK
jgi:uncharacterized protein (TIGR03067 family)